MQFDEFNQRNYERHHDQSLEDVLNYIHGMHKQFMKIVEAMPEDEMLARGRYKFIGMGSVYKWLGTFANYDRWAKIQIRGCGKSKPK